MPHQTAHSISRPSVLILDDDVVMLSFLKEYLQHDFNTRIFRSGRKALRWLYAGNQVDAMLVDLNMPDLTGFAFIEEIGNRAEFKSTPIVILSGSDRSEDRIRTLRAGASDFLTKPFNPEELQARLELRINSRVAHTAHSRVPIDRSQPAYSLSRHQFVEGQA